MKEYIIGFLLVVITVMTALWIKQSSDLNDHLLMISYDRQYWRVVANLPNTSCRVFGGQYRVTAFRTNFNDESKFSYSCEDRNE